MPSLTETEFIALLESRLGPVLRADGFVGQHWEWRRLRDPIIDCIQIQPRSDHVACCVNLGVHLTFLPLAGGAGSTDWTRISPPDCEIMNRLAWEGESDHWWTYDDGEAGVADLVACYEEHGRAYLGKFADFPRPFVNIASDEIASEAVSELFPQMTKTRKVLLLARVHDYLGNAQRAVQFSDIGQEISGVGLKAKFREILRKYQ